MSENLELDTHARSQKDRSYPYSDKPGRQFRPMSNFEISTVLSSFRQYPCNALTLENNTFSTDMVSNFLIIECMRF